MLAFGYMLDLIRCFARRQLDAVTRRTSGATPREKVFRCDLSRGEAAAIIFPAGLLDVPNTRPPDRQEGDGCALPDPEDIVACVEHLIGLGLLEGRPNIDRLCRRMKIPRRTLQRDLSSRGTSFDSVLRCVLVARASALLRARAGVFETGFELGYSDPAHFSRAFRRWTGRNPRDWRLDG
jgi:AraC-like DNA-binding protein